MLDSLDMPPFPTPKFALMSLLVPAIGALLDKSGISNEVGRYKSFFLGVGLLRTHPCASF
jgi:hypothetical protein